MVERKRKIKYRMTFVIFFLAIIFESVSFISSIINGTRFVFKYYFIALIVLCIIYDKLLNAK